MARIHVVLVEPKYEGNVGAVARAMKNFGLTELRLVRPCPLGEEARRRAMHGGDVLAAAKAFETFEEAIDGMDLIAGSSGVDTQNEKKFLRISLDPRAFAARVREMSGDVALVLGREDFGLLNQELSACDFLVTIPTGPEYPIMNVAQAAAILFYEVHGTEPTQHTSIRSASSDEKEKLNDAFADLMTVTNYPAHKRERTAVMFRRLLGRAGPSKWEFHALMGVFTRASKTIRRQRAK